MRRAHLFALVLAAILSFTASTAETLDVYFINVGQGDAILIDYGELEILIDGGPDGSCVEALRPVVDGRLEFVVATHPHSDHIGGLDDVLRVFDVGSVVTNGQRADTNAYSDFRASIDAEGCGERIVRPCERLVESGDLVIDVIGPFQIINDANEDSIVLYLHFGTVDFLFTGDIGFVAEAILLELGVLEPIEVLKVAHHGSRYSTGSEFLKAIRPIVAIYSAGVGNKYGHPAVDTLDRLTESRALTFGTNELGSIRVSTDGTGFGVSAADLSMDFAPRIPVDSVGSSTNQADVVISYIHYDGAVPRTESDEYVEISNLGSAPQDLAGWRLLDISEGYPEIIFPAFALEAGASIRVYTNEVHPEWGNFSFGSTKAVWNNTNPDTAVLYDAAGQEVSRRSY